MAGADGDDGASGGGGFRTARLGLVLVAAGAAIGPAHLWRLPLVAADHGGAAFLAVFLAVLVSIGLCLVLAELVIGRSARRNPVGSLRQIGGRPWAWLGLAQILAAFLVVSSLSVVAGWAAAAGLTFMGPLPGGDAAPGTGDGAPALLAQVLASPLRAIGGAALFTALAAGIVMLGVRRGLERSALIAVPLLFALLAVLVARTLTLDGAAAALAGFARFDAAALSGAGIRRAIEEAVGSLALGVGALIACGASAGPAAGLPRAAAAITTLSALAAVAAAVVILGLLASNGPAPASGPEVAFQLLAGAFTRMPGGTAFAALFLALLLLTMLTSAVALLEPIVAYFGEEHGFRRHQITIAAASYAFLLGVPSSLALGGVNHDILGRPLVEIIDALGFDVLVPSAVMLTALFVGWVMGRAEIAEALGPTTAARWPARAWLWALRVPVPLAIAWVLLARLAG